MTAADRLNEDAADARRRMWWEQEADRPPGATMGDWYAMPVDEASARDGGVDAASERILGTHPAAVVATMGDRDAYYWGFHGGLPRPGLVWVVGVAYDLPGEHAGRAGVRVLLTVGDKAELVTPLHSAEWPLDVPAARIAGESGVPVAELPGLWFSVGELGGADASGFRVIREL